MPTKKAVPKKVSPKKAVTKKAVKAKAQEIEKKPVISIAPLLIVLLAVLFGIIFLTPKSEPARQSPERQQDLVGAIIPSVTLRPTQTFTPWPTFITTFTVAPENSCLMIKTRPSLSVRSQKSLSVPPLYRIDFGVLIITEGVTRVTNVDEPSTPYNESLDNGIWATINRGMFIPVDLDKDNTLYAIVEPCNWWSFLPVRPLP